MCEQAILSLVLVVRRDDCGEGQAEQDGTGVGLGLWGTIQPTPLLRSCEARCPSTVLLDPCPPRIEAIRAQASLGNEKMCKIVVLPGPPHALPSSCGLRRPSFWTQRPLAF